MWKFGNEILIFVVVPHFSDMHKIHEGMGDKVAMFIQWCTTWLCAYVIAFVQGWKLALAAAAFSPLMILVAATVGRVCTFRQSRCCP